MSRRSLQIPLPALGIAAAALALSVAAACGDDPDPGFNQGSPPPGVVPVDTPYPTATPGITPQPTPGLQDLTPTPYLQAEIPLQVADMVFYGEEEEDGAGAAVAGVGDLNGDLIDDLVVGAPGSDARQPDGGKVYILFGRKEVWPWHNALADAAASLDGEGRNDRAGTTVAGGGDLNGDGLADLVIGAPGHSTGGIGAGRIYALFGKPDGWYPGQRLTSADAMLDGREGDEAGEPGTLALGGDLNGDGFDDLAVGCSRSESFTDGAGHVYVVMGRADGWERPGTLAGQGPRILGAKEGDRFGFSVAIHPDLNGDGYADLLIGAPRLDSDTESSLGAVYVFLGGADRDAGTLQAADADAVLYGVQAGEEVGAGLAALGDVDGDGQPDVAVGAWGNSAEQVSATRGRFYIVSAPPERWAGATLLDVSTRIVGDAPGDYVGRPAADAGDVNGDGVADVLFGSFLRDYPYTDTGNAYLFYGWADKGLPIGVSLQEANARFVGEATEDYAGFAVAGAGDLDGDGLADLVIGALGAGTPDLARIGKVYVMRGRPFYTE